MSVNTDKVILAKCITLLYRESLLPDLGDVSKDLVRTTMDKLVLPEISIGQGSAKETLSSLKRTVLDLCDRSSDEELDVNDLIQRIRINAENDETLFTAIEKSLKEDMVDSSIKRSITNLRRQIHKWHKDQTISDVLKKAVSSFVYNKDKITDSNVFVADLIAQLEPLQLSTQLKDPAILSKVDFSNRQEVTDIFNRLNDKEKGRRVYKTKWNRLNRMMQGGFRVGMTMTTALQHKYKSGFNKSTFADVVMANKPYTTDTNKKPLAIHFSFEDTLDESMQFLYQYLKYSEEKIRIDITKVSKEEMSDFVMSRLTSTGFHVMMLHVDPTQWDYKALFNKINELEAEGYCVELMWLDYLMMLPRTGCTGSAAGEDMRDLVRRVRNFCLAKQIVCHTPHQMSTEAKALIRGGLPEHLLVKEVTEKGYFAGSKQLDQELDLELYLHLFKSNKVWYLSIQRGKHRISSILEEDDWKYILYQFPKYGMPIPYDEEGEMSGYDKLPSMSSSASDGLAF